MIDPSLLITDNEAGNTQRKTMTQGVSHEEDSCEVGEDE